MDLGDSTAHVPPPFIETATMACRRSLLVSLVLLGIYLPGCSGFQKPRLPFPRLFESKTEVVSSETELAPTTPENDDKTVKEKQLSLQLAVARTAEASSDTSEAIKAYTKAIELNATDPVAYYRLAVLRDKSGDPRAARELYHKALELAPDDADIHCDLGYSHYLVGERDQAEASLRRALGLRPNFPRAHNNLALLLAREGRIDEALFESSQAGLSESEARTNIGLAMMLEGNRMGAEEQLRLASQAQGRGNVPQLSQLRQVIERTREPAADGNTKLVRFDALAEPSGQVMPAVHVSEATNSTASQAGYVGR